jgi:hypothetical protein
MKKDTWWIVGTLLAGVLLAPAYQYKLNPDGMSYLMLARALSKGDFVHGTSLYWSPLFSWSLVPLLWMNVPELLALKVVQAVFAAGFVATSFALLRRFASPCVVRVVMQSVLVILGLYYGFIFSSPDLLLLACICGFLALGLHPDFASRKHLAIYAGLFAGIAVLAKHVAFPLFFLVIPAFCTLWICRSPRERCALLRQWMITTFFFLLPSLSWIAVMSAHAGRLTLGGAGPLIHASEGPGHPGLPILNQGLFAPPTPQGLSVWDDPSNLHIPPWSPFDSSANFFHQLKLLIVHSGELFAAIQSFTPFALCILVWAVLRITMPREPRERWLLLAMLCTATLLALLYLPILIDERYFWLHAVLLLLMGGMLCAEALQYRLFQRKNTWVLLVALFLSFTVRPLWYLLLEFRHGDRFAMTMYTYAATYNLDRTRIAADDWKTGLFATYYAGGQYYGKPKPGTDAMLEEQLLAMDIDAYLVWGREPSFQHFTFSSGTQSPKVFLRAVNH